MFRRHRGLQLLALVEEVLPRHRSGHRGDWHISLSKPSEKEQHLLMTLVGEQGEQEMGEVSHHRLRLWAQERTDSGWSGAWVLVMRRRV